MHRSLATIIATFCATASAFAQNDAPRLAAAYASFQILTKCAVTTAANERRSQTLEGFREVYIRKCHEPERDFFSKLIENPVDRELRVSRMVQGGKMVNEMVRQAFEKTQTLRRN